MSAIDEDHYVTVEDVRKYVPITDQEIEDGTLDQVIVAKSKYIVALTNRKWAETDFLWETIQDIVARYVGVTIRERRGDMDEAEKMNASLKVDVAALLKSPFLNQTDTGETTGQSAIINVTLAPKSPYLNPNVARYKSNWARASTSGTSS